MLPVVPSPHVAVSLLRPIVELAGPPLPPGTIPKNNVSWTLVIVAPDGTLPAMSNSIEAQLLKACHRSRKTFPDPLHCCYSPLQRRSSHPCLPQSLSSLPSRGTQRENPNREECLEDDFHGVFSNCEAIIVRDQSIDYLARPSGYPADADRLCRNRVSPPENVGHVSIQEGNVHTTL